MIYMSMYTQNKIYNIYLYEFMWHKYTYTVQCKCHWKISYEKVLNDLELDKVIFYQLWNLSVSRQGSNFLLCGTEFWISKH